MQKFLAEFCNNIKIWDNLRDYIPFPYTENNAIEFIKHCQAESPQHTTTWISVSEFSCNEFLLK